MAHFNPKVAAAAAAIALGGVGTADAEQQAGPETTPEKTAEVAKETADTIELDKEELKTKAPELSSVEIAAKKIDPDSLFAHLTNDASKPVDGSESKVEVLPTQAEKSAETKAETPPSREPYSRAAALAYLRGAEPAHRSDPSKVAVSGPWGESASPGATRDPIGAAPSSPGAVVEQVEVLSSGSGKWADPSQDLRISSVHDQELYQTYQAMKNAGVVITYRNAGDKTLSASYPIEPALEQSYRDAATALRNKAGFELRSDANGNLVAVFETVTIAQSDWRGNTLSAHDHQLKAKEELTKLLQSARNTLMKIEVDPGSIQHVGVDRSGALTPQTMTREQLEAAFVGLAQESVVAQAQAERLQLLEQELRSVDPGRYRSEQDYEREVERRLGRWEEGVHRNEQKHQRELDTALARAQRDYTREYGRAVQGAHQLEKRKIQAQAEVTKIAERMRGDQNKFANDVRRVAGLTNIEQAWNKIGEVNIPQENKAPIETYLSEDVYIVRDQFIAQIEEGYVPFLAVTERDFSSPEAIVQGMSDEELREMLTQLQDQKYQALDRYDATQERLEKHSTGDAFENVIAGAMSQVEQTAIATSLTEITIREISDEINVLKDNKIETQSARLSADKARALLRAYETKVRAQRDAARGALRNWKDGQDKSIIGGVGKEVEKQGKDVIEGGIEKVGKEIGKKVNEKIGDIFK